MLQFEIKLNSSVTMHKDEINIENLITSSATPSSTTEGIINHTNSTTKPATEATTTLTTTSLITSATTTPTPPLHLSTEDTLSSGNQYCSPSLCEFYNGTHTNIKPHIACKNSGNFGPACGLQPHLLKMSERRRNLILDLHNLARSRIASGQVDGYKTASHMPQLKWDNELEYLATLHVKRCRFEHDLCHNSPRYPYSGQNIGYFWKGANITSHSKRMKNFIVNWYKEHKDANQTFIDSFHLHPERKVIGHFTAMVGDRVHHVGCAAIRFYKSNLTQILMTCNYDYNNFSDEPVYQTGPTASKCNYKISEKYPGLCDWKKPAYEYEAMEDENNNNLIIFAVLLTLCIIETSLSQTNYCRANLCKKGKHVACNNNGKFAGSCAKNAKIVRITPQLQRKIVKKHNSLRNRVASGKVNGFKGAVRMATIRWSPELSKLAEYNVKQCKMSHDKCRNTDKFSLAGQNVAKSSWSGQKKAVGTVLIEQIQSWYAEHKKCSMSEIRNLQNIAKSGHFTAMVQEKNMAVGCAILRQTSNGQTMQLMACNYAYTNILGSAVYRDGSTASKCTTGRNPNFKSLCSFKEKSINIQMFNGKICILLLVVMPAVFAQTNYCRANLCTNGRKHIACGNKGKFSSVCKNPKMINITPALRDRIVNKHNTLRNKIAAGFGKFPKAERMATMVWSNELAKLAEYNVKQCKMQHDQCRNTNDFSHAGQNIAMTTWSGKDMSIGQVINTHIQNWFNEYKHCPLSVIKNYSSPTSGKAYGHFTAMVQDKSTHIGCAIIRSKKNSSTQQIMTCNYAYTNMKNTPVYRGGPSASKLMPSVFAQTNYCRANLCTKGRKHIACQNKGKFASVCKNPKIIKITPALRNRIVNRHNTLRNKIAAGFGKFPKAERMATMVWSNELAKLAEYNVKQCKMQHDQCRNTNDFSHAGQNIAMTTWSGKNKSIGQVINTHIQNWFNEYKHCPVSVIKNYASPKSGKAYGHFTAMVQDKSTHIGCAIIRSKKNRSIQQIMTCNYAYTNVKKTPVYRSGHSASKCKTGKDKNGKIYTLFLVLLPAVFAQTNYCSPNLCRNGRKHIACNNNGNFAETCRNPRIIEITPAIRIRIVNKHNALRNQIAQGFGEFPPAARMAGMIWNNELAKLAEYNVKQCEMRHDQCRNTKDFPYAGQNIAVSYWRGMQKTVLQVVNNHIQSWFNEYKDCPVEVIQSYSKPDTGKAIGHFTAMIQDKATHVGCAILRYNKNGYIQQLMTCNYAYTNVKRAPVYEQGPTASNCTSGTHKRFPSLCSLREKYN
ncbi:Venom allergen 3 [Lucilia cuprina]|nr:Venom allergen 3 [Lucilia cuprina]